MKRHLFSISAAILTVASLCAASSARLDFFNNAGEFFSVLESDLTRLSYLLAEEASPDSGFDKLRIETADGERVIIMADCAKIAYAPATGTEPFAIEVTTDGHCTVTMLDCLNNDGEIDPSKPNDWHGAESDYLGHFIYSPEYGYEMRVDITGQWTGKVYTSDEDFVFFVSAQDYAGWTDSWGFFMPNEPITIEGVSTELTTYSGRDFVGEYNGYEIRKDPLLDSPEQTVFNIDLRANGSYVVTTDDDNAYDFHFMYTYDEEQDMARHIEVEQPKWDNSTHYYGATSTFLGDDFIYVYVHDYTSNKPEDKNLYLAAKEDFAYTYAAGEFGKEYLLEAITADQTAKYVYVYNYGAAVKLAEVEFLKGGHLSDDCEAIVSYDSETRLKYINDGDANPVFIAKGSEAGTYVMADDIVGDYLTLDGFGGATIGDETHSYTVESGIVTFDNGRVFNIDVNEKTYQEVLQNDEWDGPTEFYIEDAKGAYGNTESDKCYASLKFDQDLNGNDNPGYAALTISVWNSGFARLSNITSSNPRYIYNKDNRTIILSGVLVGTGSGYTTERRDIVMRVSDDKQSIWFDETANGDRIYGTSSPTDYFYTGEQNTLVAPSTTPTVQGTYTTSFQIYMMGTAYPMYVDASLVIDDGGVAGRARLNISNVFNNYVVDYELTDDKLILKDIDYLDSSFTPVTSDLEFTITPEGNLLGSGMVYSNSLYGVDLGSAEFVPQAD